MPTSGEVLQKTNRIKPNRYGDEVLTGWLSALDGRCVLETIGMEALGLETPPAYTWPEDADTMLLIPDPFAAVYELYLVAMIDFHNREMDSYQNDMEAFNRAMSDWLAWYRRTNRPEIPGGVQNVLL